MQKAVDDMAKRIAIARKISPWLNTQMAAFYLGVSVSTLEKMRCKGEGPVFHYHGRQVRYHIDDLDDWSGRHKHKVVDRRKYRVA